MNRDEALNVITIMATAWPYPEWDEGRVELWCAALNDADGADAALAAVKAVKSLDRAPTVGLPESSATPASKETALAGLAAARAALQRRDADG
jgi:hypothetical protein